MDTLYFLICCTNLCHSDGNQTPLFRGWNVVREGSPIGSKFYRLKVQALSKRWYVLSFFALVFVLTEVLSCIL